MSELNEENQFTVLENKVIGRNFAKHRKFREKKALEVADYLGMTVANYTKYERGENKITVDIIQKVSEFLKVDPLQLIASNAGHVIENSNSPNSPIAIQDNSSFQTTNEEQTKLITKLVENVIAMNDKIMKLLDREGDNGEDPK